MVPTDVPVDMGGASDHAHDRMIPGDAFGEHAGRLQTIGERGVVEQNLRQF